MRGEKNGKRRGKIIFCCFFFNLLYCNCNRDDSASGCSICGFYVVYIINVNTNTKGEVYIMFNKQQFNQACTFKQQQLSNKITEKENNRMKARNDRQRKLRVVREYYGLTVEELAKLINVSEKTIYRYETHQFKRPTNEIIKCSIWYNENLLQLMKEIDFAEVE